MLSIVMLECLSSAKRFLLKTASEKKFLSSIIFFVLILVSLFIFPYFNAKYFQVIILLKFFSLKQVFPTAVA